MSGNTGKMTAEAIQARGPRTVLARNLDTGKLFYYPEDRRPAVGHAVIARSYTLSYLKRIAKYNA